MITKCNCEICNGGIEFDPSDYGILKQGREFGKHINCPHCDKQTLIFIPQQKPAKKQQDPVVEQPKQDPEFDIQNLRSRADGLDATAKFCFIASLVLSFVGVLGLVAAFGVAGGFFSCWVLCKILNHLIFLRIGIERLGQRL